MDSSWRRRVLLQETHRRPPEPARRRPRQAQVPAPHLDRHGKGHNEEEE